MSQMPNTPVKPPPTYVNQPVPTTSGAGRGCGCVIFGCGSILLLLIVLCGAGWYITWYTSLPLNWLASTFESSGDVKIEGVSGTFSKGFEVEQFQFREGADQKWSKINDLKIKYGNTKSGFFSSSGAAIEEVSIGSATFYGDFNLDTSGDIRLLDITEPIEELWQEISSDVKTNISEFRVDLVRFANIEFRDQDDNVQFRVDEIKFSGLKVVDNQLEDIGDLNVVVDHLTLKSEPSERFSKAQLSRRLVGQMDAGFLNQVKQTIPFDLEIGLTSDGQVLQQSKWFGGKLIIDRSEATASVTTTVQDFSSADFLDLPEPAIIPQAINLKLENSAGKRGNVISVDAAGSFQLGQTRFDNFQLFSKDQIATIRGDNPDRRVNGTDRQFVATGKVNGETVTALVSVTSYLTLLDVQLFSATEMPVNELWARTAYGKSFEELPETARNMIERHTRNHVQSSTDSGKPSNAEKSEEAEHEAEDESIQAEKGGGDDHGQR